MSALLERGRAETFDADSLLVERFLSGDADAFEQIYRRYYDKVYALARGIVLNSDDAADAVQEVFALVYRNIRRFNHRSRFSTWLFRVAVNRVIQHARKLKHQNRQAPLTEDSAQVVIDEAQPADPRIERALAALSPADRAILSLFYWEDLSLQEIASTLGCGVNAAKTRLYRARERFRAAYGEVDS